MRKVFFFICALLCVFLEAQDKDTNNFPPPETPQEIEIVKSGGEIKLDGLLNEPDWGKSTITDDFFRTEPRQGGTLKYGTNVRFL
ncbi:MAG: hypothetical protein AAFX53_12050, partial [Bacteroidota bacterium]